MFHLHTKKSVYICNCTFLTSHKADTSYKHFSCSMSICLWNSVLTIPVLYTLYMYLYTRYVLNLPKSFRSKILFLARSRCSSPIESLTQLMSGKPREHTAFYYLISVLLYLYVMLLYFLDIHNYISSCNVQTCIHVSLTSHQCPVREHVA